MHSQVEQLSPVLVEVKVEVPWPSVQETLETAYRKVQRTAHVRGFRPGKVPRSVVKSLMGKTVEREVLTQLFDQSLQSAVVEHQIDPIAVADIGEPAIQEGKPLSFRIKVEVRPKIDEVNTSEIVVARTLEPVTDAEVEAELEEQRKRNAELVTPEPPRPAKEGDVLSLKIEVTVDGLPRSDLGSDDTRVTVGEEQLLPEIESVLPGASVGEERSAHVTFPADYSHEPLRGKVADFRVHVKEHFEAVLPALDDDFARDLEHESLDAMRASTRSRLEDAARRRSEALIREQVIETLIDKNPVPVPPTMVERQAQGMVEELRRLEQMLGSALPWNEESATQLKARAERKVRAGLLLGAIATREKIEVTDEDVEARLQQVADQTGKHIAKVRAEYRDDRRDGLRSQILQSKLIDYLVSCATIRDQPAEETKAAEPEAEPEEAGRSSKRKSAEGPEGKAEGKAKTASKPEAEPRTEAKAATKAPTKAPTKVATKAKTAKKAKPKGA